jgi:hypothetical protein
VKTLQEFLEENMRDGLDFTLRVSYQAEDAGNLGFTGIGFYIHPADRDGETLSFVVRGNRLYSAEFPQNDGTTLVDYGLAVVKALREQEISTINETGKDERNGLNVRANYTI